MGGNVKKVYVLNHGSYGIIIISILNIMNELDLCRNTVINILKQGTQCEMLIMLNIKRIKE